MTKTIELTPKATKWIFIFNGTINSVIGISQLLRTDSMTTWGSVLGIILAFTGPLMILYGIILFNSGNKLTPRVNVDENGILIKTDIHKGQRKIDWENVKEITYKPFELSFLLKNDDVETVNLQTNGAISIVIKKTIRQFADDRQIRVIGG